MGKKHYVFSTLASDVKYTEWKKGADAGTLAIEGRSILIRGGTGVMNDRLVTPLGICTEVDDEDLKLLEDMHLFQMHKENGHIVVQSKKADPEAVAADMNLADPGAPMTPSDYAEAGENKAKPSAKNS